MRPLTSETSEIAGRLDPTEELPAAGTTVHRRMGEAMIGCPDCGTLQDLPALPPRGAAVCVRCEAHLERTSGRNTDATLACASATFLLLFPANLLTLMSVSVAGAERHSRLADGIATIWNQGWPTIAVFLGAFGIVLPVLRFPLLSAALAALRLGRSPCWLGPTLRWATALDQWAMPDVFLERKRPRRGVHRCTTRAEPSQGASGPLSGWIWTIPIAAGAGTAR